MVYIDIKKLGFSYDNKKKILNGLSLKLSNFNSYSIIGPCAIGKTTLINCINGNLSYDGKIKIDYYQPIYGKKVKPVIVTITEEEKFFKDSLYEELEYVLNSRGFNVKDSKFLIDELISLFNLGLIINKKFLTMSYEEKVISNLLINTVIKPDLVLIDDLFKYLDNDFKAKYIKYLLNNNIVLVNVISDMNDALFTEYTVVLIKGGKIAVEGPTMGVVQEEKLIKRIGLELPFMVDLSIQLCCYGLLDKIYLNKDEMVNDIWK